MKYRTIFISDVHLGTKGCSAEELLDFLRNNEADKIYLVGDIIDCWRLTKRIYWPQLHNDIIQKILRKSRKGTEIVYIPGNHDEFLRPFANIDLGNIHIKREAVHISATGKRILVIHGDKFDGVARYQMWLAKLGSEAYDWMIEFNRIFNCCRKKCGLKYWSISAYLKKTAKDAMSFINNFEKAVADHCKDEKYDGIISGHIHHGEIKYIDGILYMNDGDWVESRGALVELDDGTFQYLEYAGPGNYKVKIQIDPDGVIERYDVI